MLIRCGRGSWVTFVHLFVILVIVLWCIINTRKFFELKTEKKEKEKNDGENEDIDEDADHN